MALHKLPKGYSSEFRLPNKKPIGKVELDKSKGISKGLTGAWIWQQGNKNLVTKVNTDFPQSGSTKKHSYKYGEYLSRESNSTTPITGDITTAKEYTIVAMVSVGSTVSGSSHSALFGTVPSGGGKGVEMLVENSNNKVWWAAQPDFAVNYTGDVITRDTPFFVAISYSAVDGVKVYYNGILTDTSAATAAINPATANIQFFNRGDGISPLQSNGDNYYTYMYDRPLSGVEIKSLYDNPYQILKPKNDPVYFTSDAAGGSITVSPTLGTISYSGNATTIGLFGSIDVTATLGTISYAGNNTTVGLFGVVDVSAGLGTISYTSNNATIQFSGAIEVNPTLGAISYTSNATTVQVSGSIDVTATLGAISYTSNNTVVDLGGAITVAAGLGTINYVSNNTIVGLAGQIGINATLGTISYTSNNTIVIASNGQSIGEVDTSFAGDLYGSNFKPNSITVTFRG